MQQVHIFILAAVMAIMAVMAIINKTFLVFVVV